MASSVLLRGLLLDGFDGTLNVIAAVAYHSNINTSHRNSARVPPAMGDRPALLSSAISALRDPSTASSPLSQRIGFPKLKGPTPQEIEHALLVASSSAPGKNQAVDGEPEQ